MSTSATPTRIGRRAGGRAAAVGVVCALALAACGSNGGSSDGAARSEPPAKAKATTTTAPDDATTTTAAAETDALPTTVADAPSGDWISVRFQVAIEPEPDEFNPGLAEARLYDIEPDCSGSGPCRLTFTGGGDDGSFGMPDTPALPGDPVTLEPEDGAWTDTYQYPDAAGCSAELDGPYLETHEERSLDPVYDDDGAISGLVGTLVLTDTLNDAGRAAGCPASAEATYAYAVVVAPNDGLGAIDGYDVDGTFRQTLEVTAAEGQVDPRFQEGGISTSVAGHDLELSGSCEDGECAVDLEQTNGDGAARQVDLTSEDGRSLSGTYEESGGCADDVTGEIVFDTGAYDTAGGWEELTPVWVEDGEVKAFVGRYSHAAEPTAQGKTDPSCSTPQALEGWAYLVDTEILG